MKRIALAASLLLGFVACASTNGVDKLTHELLTMPKSEIYARGEKLLSKHRFEQARKYLNYLYETYPNDPLGQKALLLVADSYFTRGRTAGYVEARYRYRDYLTRYPLAPDRDFALYRFALCYDREHETADRDPTNTREALTQYERLIREEPDSKYAVEAKKRVGALTDMLADHEFDVGLFYFHKGDPAAALGRFLYAEDHFPDYGAKDRLTYFIASSLERLGRAKEADRYFARLEAEFPKSLWAARARKEKHPRG